MVTKQQKKTFLTWLETLALTSNRWRGDCPVCGGQNTLSVHKEFGNVVYHCFRASCGLSGSTRKESSYEELVALATAKEPDITSIFVIPDFWVSVDSRLECIEYLIKNNSFEAYREKRVELRYDPKEHRIVFLIMEDGECYGAIGRSLDNGRIPKWLNYASGSFPFICKRNVGDRFPPQQTLIVVEDCASACSASSASDACALLGTSIRQIWLDAFKPYTTVYIALDKDASVKAVDIQRYLSYYHDNVKVLLLEKDLKYCSSSEIEGMVAHESLSV